MEEFEFRLLGPIEARRNRAAVSLGGRKQRAVLALLLLEAPTPVAPWRFVDELDTTPAALHVHIARLRRGLGADAIVTRPAGYGLAAPTRSVDVHTFERLVRGAAQAGPHARSETLGQALALWRGHALADFVDLPFARPASARLEELRLVAEELRLEAELRLGRHASALPRLAALVVEHPFRESLRALFMTALYRRGRQADALAVYREARRLLADELGLEPSRVLRAAERAILLQEKEISTSYFSD